MNKDKVHLAHPTSLLKYRNYFSGSRQVVYSCMCSISLSPILASVSSNWLEMRVWPLHIGHVVLLALRDDACKSLVNCKFENNHRNSPGCTIVTVSLSDPNALLAAQVYVP